MPGMARADVAELRAFSGTALIIGLVAHGLTSMLVGLLYAVILPMLPRRHMLWGGLIAPLLWTGVLWALLGVDQPGAECAGGLGRGSSPRRSPSVSPPGSSCQPRAAGGDDADLAARRARRREATGNGARPGAPPMRAWPRGLAGVALAAGLALGRLRRDAGQAAPRRPRACCRREVMDFGTLYAAQLRRLPRRRRTLGALPAAQRSDLPRAGPARATAPDHRDGRARHGAARRSRSRRAAR